MLRSNRCHRHPPSAIRHSSFAIRVAAFTAPAAKPPLPCLELRGIVPAMPKQTNPDYLNGVPELIALQLIAHRAMYGYQLVEAIKSTSGAALQFGEGCIYPILHRLEADGDLSSRREVVGGRSRVVYRITASGRKRLAGRIAAWRTTVAAVNHVLKGGGDGQPAFT
jgi:PadR family transcriptional regulator, regulatory protein PadR